MITDLKDITIKDAWKFGKKASALGELIKNGISVPPGFAFSATIYDYYMQYNKFPFKPEDFMAYNNEIKEFILNTEFPNDLEVEIKNFINNMSESKSEIKFAVRSSALCEDMEDFSMAGMFESFINLDSFDEIKMSIKKCYASLFSNNVLSFMFNNHLKMEDLKMGVVIQVFISGNISGVIFTADTLDMNQDIITINSVDGLCSNYVSGENPSSIYTVSKSTGEEVSRQVEHDSTVLKKNEISELYKLSKNIEKIFGCYQDIEWTISNYSIYILQARPITTFRSKDFHITWSDINDKEYSWYRFQSNPFTPLMTEITCIQLKNWARVAVYNKYNEISIQNSYMYLRVREAVDEDERNDYFAEELDSLFNKRLNIFQDVILPELQNIKGVLDNYLARKLTCEESIAFIDKSIEYLETASKKHWYAWFGRKYIPFLNHFVKHFYMI